jgi:ERCC4-type nuclease
MGLNIFSKSKEKERVKEKVIVDNRERNSLVATHLVKEGFDVEWKQLPVGDYIVKGVAIERKTVSDLKSSIINKRIIQQLLELKQYSKHLLLVEGILDEDVYNGGIHENAFRGFLLSVALDYNVPLIFTHDEEDTARYILVLAKKQERPETGIRASKIMMTLEERQQFVLEGFPNVGPKKARRLLEKFGSLKNIFESSEDDLKDILGVRNSDFRKMLDHKFKRKKF